MSNEQLHIAPDLANGHYSNLAVVSHSKGEFTFDFAYMLPFMERPEVCSRVVMSPDHARRFFLALQDNLRRYEETFGTQKEREQDEYKSGKRKLS